MDIKLSTEKQQLSAIAQELLRPELDYTAIRNNCIALSGFFCGLTGFNPEDEINQVPVSTATGQAVSPYGAMSCIRDMMRTRNFMQGVHAAIHSRLHTNPGQPVMVFYAGTGPFATLLIPLTTVFSPGQLQLVLMDINPISISYLRKLISKLGLEPYIRSIETTDAATYIIPDDQQPDILVTETMKAGLLKEPQFSICENLLPQCVRDPVLIPEMIKVELCLSGSIMNQVDEKQSLATLIMLRKSLFDGSAASQKELSIIREGILVAVSINQEERRRWVVLDTYIRIFKQHELKYNESGLTMSVNLSIFSQNTQPSGLWRIRYNIQAEPFFEFSREQSY